MAIKIAFAGTGKSTKFTFEWFFIGVLSHVNGHVGRSVTNILAEFAEKHSSLILSSDL